MVHCVPVDGKGGVMVGRGGLARLNAIRGRGIVMQFQAKTREDK